MKGHRIVALVVRHLYLYRRSLPRIMEIFYWPFLDLVIWGFITMYLAKYQPQVPGFVTFFLGALILWDMLFRSQQGITISFLEELWARNLMNLFASPLDAGEFLAATMAMSIFKVTCVSIVMGVCAWLFYGYNMLIMGLWLLPVCLEFGDYRMGHRGVDDLSHHAVRPGGGNIGLEPGVSIPADLLRVLSAGGVARLASG